MIKDFVFDNGTSLFRVRGYNDPYTLYELVDTSAGKRWVEIMKARSFDAFETDHRKVKLTSELAHGLPFIVQHWLSEPVIVPACCADLLTRVLNCLSAPALANLLKIVDGLQEFMEARSTCLGCTQSTGSLNKTNGGER